MAQGSRATEGPTSTYTGALLTGDGVSELCDHLLTDRCLKDRREEGGGGEGGQKGRRQTQRKQAAKQDSGKAVHKQESRRVKKNQTNKEFEQKSNRRGQLRKSTEMHGIWKKWEGTEWLKRRKEKEMGKDEEMDRHRRISKEQKELLQFQHTKHQNVV